MLDWFAGAVESAKAMKDIGQSLLTIRDETIIKERVYDLNNNLMDLQQKLLEAQLNQMELVKRIQELEGEKQKANQSNDFKTQYAIHTFPTSDNAYVLKSEETGAPTLYFCSHCFETEAQAITLQGARVKSCPKCKTVVRSAPQPQRFR